MRVASRALKRLCIWRRPARERRGRWSKVSGESEGESVTETVRARAVDTTCHFY